MQWVLVLLTLLSLLRSLPQSTIRFRVPDSVFELEAQENPRLATLKEKFFRTVRREKREHKLLDFLQYSDHYAVTGNVQNVYTLWFVANLC